MNIITDKGFILPTFEEIYQRKLNDFKTVKPNIRETDSNLIITLLKFDAIEEYDSYLQALTLYNNLNVYTAVGSNLNNITSHLNITWLEERYATGKIEIQADNGTIIPQAYGVETKSGIRFVTLNTTDVEVVNGSITLDIIASEGGTIGNVSPNQITEMTEVVSGIKSINNSMSILGGRDRETDTELRERYLARIDRKSSFTTIGIKNYILNNTLVKKCQVIENDTDLNDADGRLPHSYEAICLGDTDDNILQALYDYKLAGIRAVGDIKKQFGDISVGFSRPIEIQLEFTINIDVVKEIWKDEYKKTIENIIYQYVDNLDPQETIYSYKILGEIYKNTGGVKTVDIKINKFGNVQKYTDYQLLKKEIATVKTINVNVVM